MSQLLQKTHTGSTLGSASPAGSDTYGELKSEEEKNKGYIILAGIDVEMKPI
jgi:hypothetical protein